MGNDQVRETDIEELVTWAYRFELPKREISDDLGSKWQPISGYGELLTVIDDEPRFPAIMGPPHPDALTIERAVQGLADELQIDWQDHAALLLGDLHPEFRPAESPIGRLVFSEVALIESCARLGRGPLWDVGRPRLRRINGRNNRPVLIGECKDAGRYSLDARCPLQLVDPTIEQLAFKRAEYLVWRGALARVAGTLRGWLLRDHVVVGPIAPVAPWLDDRRAVPTPPPIQGVAPAWRTWPAVKRRRSQRAKPDGVPNDA